MYSPKEVCDKLGISYETLRFYCKEGLIPNIHRDKNNWRVFDDRNVNWIEGLLCLRRCDMSLKDMKQYMNLCLKGKESIPERKEMLAKTRDELLAKQKAASIRNGKAGSMGTTAPTAPRPTPIQPKMIYSNFFMCFSPFVFFLSWIL